MSEESETTVQQENDDETETFRDVEGEWRDKKRQEDRADRILRTDRVRREGRY